MNAPGYPNLSDPVTAPVPHVTTFASLPASTHSRVPPEHMSEAIVLRNGTRPTFEACLRTVASANHPLQDGACIAPLPTGGVIVAVNDATTNAKGVAPEDATQVVMQTLQEDVNRTVRRGRSISAHQLMRSTHVALRRWLNDRPQSICGVAQSVVVISSTGFVESASIGDTRVLVYQAATFWRRARLVDLNPSASQVNNRSLRSALGQGGQTPLRLELSQAWMKPGDLLLMGSDGGIPPQQTPELANSLAAYTSDRKRHQATLESLAAGLDGWARRQAAYDDDRTLVVLERLSAKEMS